MKLSFPRLGTALLAAAATIASAALVIAHAQPPVSESRPAARELKSFTLFVYEPLSSFDLRSDTTRSREYWSSFANYGEQLIKAGVMRGGSAVHPISDGKAVSTKDGKVETGAIRTDHDELVLGGYFVIAAADLDEAVEWASKCPATITGSVHVRENVPASPAMRVDAECPSPTGTNAAP